MEEGNWAQLKELLLLAAPNSFTYLINMAIPLISTLFLGRIGEIYLGAALLGNMLANATGLSVGLGLTMALDTLCSQAYGAQHYRLVGLHCQRGMLILTVSCLPILAVWSQTYTILRLVVFFASHDFVMWTYQVQSILYVLALQVWRLMPGLWPWLMFECFRRFLLAQNITWITTASLISVVLLHILNTWYLSIYLGWGIRGAAIAVTLANWLQLILALAIYFVNVRFFARSQQAGAYELTRSNTPPPDSLLAPLPSSSSTPPRSASPMPMRASMSSGSLQDLSSPQDTAFLHAPMHPVAISAADAWPPISTDVLHGWKDYLALGAPASVSMFLEWGAYEIYSAMAARLPGTVPLATHAILTSTAGIWYMAPLGLATACSTLVGNALGANQPNRAQRFAALGVAVVMVFGVLNGAAAMLYRNYWGEVWSPDVAVQRMVAFMMPYMALYSFADVTKCAGTAILRGTGRPMLVVIGNAISSLLIGYPSAFLLVFAMRWELAGLWTAMSLAWVTSSAIYSTFLLRTDWQREASAAEERNQSALETLSSVVSVVEAIRDP